MKVITLTLNPALDKNAKIDGLVPGSKLRCHSIRHQPGGGGINVSRLLKRLELGSYCVYPSGGDTGTYLTALLKEEGLVPHPVKIKDWIRENLSIVDTKTNLQYRFGMPGNELSDNELESIKTDVSKHLDTGDFLILSGSLATNLPENFYSELIQYFSHKKPKILVDTSGPALLKALEHPVYLIKPNQRELAQLAGKEFLSNIEQENFAKELVNTGKAKYVAVSLGAKGAFLACKEGVFYQSTPSVQVKSTIGAGDSMVAGLIYGINKGYKPNDILKMGVACGVATIMSEGTSLASPENIQKALQLMSS
ncbi:1-phosphofructokinase family hexose kinase [Flaviramulus sp. BrNp1-15]|uniref:1-phosphofructokinase family hexose kinase n=1 Tax=Flaviramulus sp. BrNp1-15 TaxID=2916754 RepID=UPI001EE9AAAC|nr:1-phosphofructokinase family hexose kinase [Flaviramulus sp. BrNp1-15]ULC58184.1 1-phosphofructokinase family hexose kinase [Flaviramulus sp. BrNp1-15]